LALRSSDAVTVIASAAPLTSSSLPA
jgi:hypothetical protein